MASIFAAVSFPSAGILTSSVWRRAPKIKLSAGRSSETAGPRLPPCRTLSREATEKPLVCSVSLWHAAQRVSKVGRTSVSKNRMESAENGCAHAAETPTLRAAMSATRASEKRIRQLSTRHTAPDLAQWGAAQRSRPSPVYHGAVPETGFGFRKSRQAESRRPPWRRERRSSWQPPDRVAHDQAPCSPLTPKR